MELGPIWIFVAAIVIVFAMTGISGARGKRDAAKYRAEYERSLQVQAEMLELVREMVTLQQQTVQRLDTLAEYLAKPREGQSGNSPR